MTSTASKDVKFWYWQKISLLFFHSVRTLTFTDSRIFFRIFRLADRLLVLNLYIDSLFYPLYWKVTHKFNGYLEKLKGDMNWLQQFSLVFSSPKIPRLGKYFC